MNLRAITLYYRTGELTYVRAQAMYVRTLPHSPGVITGKSKSIVLIVPWPDSFR